MSAVLGNTNVLVVEDNEDNRDLVCSLLEQAGASVTVAPSVDLAVQEFRSHPAHVVITDIRLGQSDGYALLEAIRKCNAEYRGFTPVIALTGYASSEDEEKAMAAGFYAYVRKPFDAEDLIATIKKGFWSATDLAA